MAPDTTPQAAPPAPREAPRVLVLDRPSRSTRELAGALGAAGYEVVATEDPAEALAHVRAGGPDVCLCEPGLGGGELLAAALRSPRRPPVLFLVDFASESQTLELLQQGAFDTIARPAEARKVLVAVDRALERSTLLEENERLREALDARFELGQLVSRDERMRRVFQTVESVADASASLLVLGESGTGKTVLARAVHERSPRRDGPFVVVNCGALPATLLESELFGHERGAFTGAVRSRAGKFEAADGGTLFLDEIATASPELQIKLLRVLEEGRFERVGDTSTREVDVRLIAATNVDLAAEVDAGRFRADLFYRIHVVAVRIPPLRERPADVPLLAGRFLERFVRLHGRDVEGFEPAAMGRLVAHDWPGNVRELENTVERAVLLARGPRLALGDLWPEAEPRSAGAARGEPAAAPWGDLPLGPLKEVLGVAERWLVLRALRHHGGNRQATAKTLGVNRTTLFNKMRKYDLLSFPARLEEGDPPPEGGWRAAG